LLGLRDVSRTDAVVTPSGEIYFLEVNVSPGLTETSLLPMATEAAGRSLGEIYAELIDRAINRA
jgi:D-alanine-D-alanine ligase